MGLDITAYKNIKLLKVSKDIEKGQPAGYDRLIYLSPAEQFPTEEGIKHGWYTFDEEYHFRAGPCSSYSFWRKELGNFVGYPNLKETIWKKPKEHKDVPFKEILWFSDCEGIMNSQVCTDLYKDFADHFEAAQNHDHNPPQYYHWAQLYNEFKKAFELAKENGVLVFS